MAVVHNQHNMTLRLAQGRQLPKGQGSSLERDKDLEEKDKVVLRSSISNLKAEVNDKYTFNFLEEAIFGNSEVHVLKSEKLKSPETWSISREDFKILLERVAEKHKKMGYVDLETEWIPCSLAKELYLFFVRDSGIDHFFKTVDPKFRADRERDLKLRGLIKELIKNVFPDADNQNLRKAINGIGKNIRHQQKRRQDKKENCDGCTCGRCALKKQNEKERLAFKRKGQEMNIKRKSKRKRLSSTLKTVVKRETEYSKLARLLKKLKKSKFPGLSVECSVKKGRGLYTTKTFRKGDIIVSFNGSLVKGKAEVKKITNKLKKSKLADAHLVEYKFQDKAYGVCVNMRDSAAGLARYVNHSITKQNAKLVPLKYQNEKGKESHIPCLVAYRDICPNEEVLIDYGDRDAATRRKNPFLYKYPERMSSSGREKNNRQ